MGTTTERTTSTTTRESDIQTSERQRAQQSGYQQLVAGAESPLEALMRQLAAQIFMQAAGEAQTGFGVTAEGVLRGGVSAEQRGMVNEWQQAALAQSRAAMQGQYDEGATAIANQMASRGLLDSSYTAGAMGLMGRDMNRQFAIQAEAARQQAAQQMLALSGQNQNLGLNLLGMQTQARQWAANPQLLRDLMEFRLRTGRVTSGATSSSTTAGAQVGNETAMGRSTTRTTAPPDWGGILGGLGSIAGMMFGGPLGAVAGGAVGKLFTNYGAGDASLGIA